MSSDARASCYFPTAESRSENTVASEIRNITIRVENLSKCYHIYQRPQDRLKQFVIPRANRLFGQAPRIYHQEFWALRDVSFEINRGETLGIIGRNGSGKSTLLQLICGTLTPTGGKVEIHGRVAALLELGAGFNPEFTGRENVYMNASILGLSKEEIDSRFDAIAEFAGIGDFIEQPVKTYSSGMYVRLAFAVIAHVDADILIVDEALSVGDAVFVQKCMRFIRLFQEHGTLIFVSHDIAAVQSLCQSALWLDKGSIRLAGSAKHVAEAYLQYTLQEIYGEEAKLNPLGPASAAIPEASEAPPARPAIDYGATAAIRDNLPAAKGWRTGRAEILAVALTPLSPGAAGIFEGGERVRMTIRARAIEALRRPIIGFLVRDRLGQDLFGENTLPFTNRAAVPIDAGAAFEGIFEFRLPMLPNGQYAVMASVADGDLYENVQHHWLHDALIINVSSSRIRWGLVGIPFERVELEVCRD